MGMFKHERLECDDKDRLKGYNQYRSFEKGDSPGIRVVTIVVRGKCEGRVQFLGGKYR